MDQNLATINAAVQLTAVLSFQYFSFIFPLYAVMIMLSLLIFFQTIAGAVTFAGIKVEKSDKNQTPKKPMITFLVAVLYLLSCYHIHLIGYSTFALIAATHATIMLTSSFFMWTDK